MSEPTATVRCLRCDTPTKYVRTKALQHAGLLNLLGELFELANHSEELDLHVCPRCGHVEFFVSGVGEEYRADSDGDGDGSTSHSTWRCPQCSTRVPDTFDICWKCQHLRPTGEDTIA